MTPGEISGLRALLGRATPGPWEWDAGVIPPDGPGRYSDIYVMGEDREPITIAEFNDSIPEGRDNAAFTVAAVNFVRNDLPALHAKIAELEGERDEARIALNRGRRADEDCPIAAHLDDMYARSDDDQDKMHLAMAAYELRRGPFDHPDHFGCEIEADELRQQIESLLAERDAASARVGEMREALNQARSDFHLITLHGDMHSMWIEAKAARDRTHEALTKEDSRG